MKVKKSRIFMLHPGCNRGKIAALDALLDAYVAYVGTCVGLLIERRIFSLPRSEKQAFFPAAAHLTSQIEKNARDHARAIVLGWAKAAYTNTVRPAISRLQTEKEIDDEEAAALYTVGRRLVQGPGGRVKQEHLDRYWALLLGSVKQPEITSRIGMRLSEMTCRLEMSKTTDHADWWLQVSTLTPRVPVLLPLVGNPYIESPGEVTHGLLARRDRRGRWRFEVMERTPVQVPEATEDMPRIGIDVGMHAIAATSDGRLLGTDLKPRFDRLHARVKTLRRNRQRQGLKENSPRLDRLEQKLSGMAKSATGRVSNELVQAYPGHVFVVEDLNLSGCRGPKRYCYRALHHALEGKAPTLAVNPAYTSQACPSCGFFHAKNRKGTRFKCVRCGRISHADVVGGIGVLGRSGDKHIDLEDRPSHVREVLARQYWDRRNPGQDRPRDFLKKAPAPSGPRLTTRVSPARASQAQPQGRPA